MIVFEADKKPLHFMLDQIDNHQVALPDFQRSFVWNAGMVRELLVSVFSSYPAGTLLLLQGGAEVFAPRPVESAPPLVGLPPYLVLDGQQRLTSLYQAFRGTGSHRFFINVQTLVDAFQQDAQFDVDDAVQVLLASRAKFAADIDGQAKYLMLPMSRVANYMQWVLEIKGRRDDGGELEPALFAIQEQVIRAYEQYQFPVTTLGASTSTEAVCSIFETLNRTGIKLSVFELLTARAFASGYQLRDLWKAAKETHTVLDDFRIDPYDLLQVLSLWHKGGAKRSQVLSMTPDEIVGRWDEAAAHMARVLQMLRDECGVLAPRWVPYGPAMVTLTAVWPHVAAMAGPPVGAARGQLKRWFWAASFTGRYDNAAATAIGQDVQSVGRWLQGGEAPDYVTNFRFDAARWRDVTPRQRALYAASMALLMANGPLDFHTGHALTQQIIESTAVDDHHIFPKAFVAREGLAGPVDSILNRTLIDKLTNIRIRASAPSKYLHQMRSAMGDGVDTLLASHHIPTEGSGAPWNDDFGAFLDARTGVLTNLLSTAIGQPLISDSPVEPPAPEPDAVERFRAALDEMWPQVEHFVTSSRVDDLEALAGSVRAHLDGTEWRADAQRIGAEVEAMLRRWEDYDEDERRVAYATAAYFLATDDAIPDASEDGLSDDERVVRAAEGVLGGWSPLEEGPPERDAQDLSAVAEVTSSDTAKAFERAMKDVYVRAKREVGYDAKVFLRMLAEHGGVDTARRLLASSAVSDGFVALWERGRVDLAVENVVLRSEYEGLFSEDERETARQRLREYGFDVN